MARDVIDNFAPGDAIWSALQTTLGAELVPIAIIVVAGVAMTEPWRWAGALLARDLDIESEVFRWVKAVSTALVAGLIARMIVFPSGALASVVAPARYGAFLGGVALFLLLPARLGHGLRVLLSVMGSAGLLLAFQLTLGGQPTG